ncbi:MAG: hypothetical protein GF393_07745 [Armatimonadia bacterium]|nr:hypothetical protein [Armatimonadia bacterium]
MRTAPVACTVIAWARLGSSLQHSSPDQFWPIPCPIVVSGRCPCSGAAPLRQLTRHGIGSRRDVLAPGRASRRLHSSDAEPPDWRGVDVMQPQSTAHGQRVRSNRRRRRGGVTLETAFTLPLLTVIFFGVVEIGLMTDTVVELSRVAREAARGASRGWTPAQIDTYVQGLENVDPQELTSFYEYQPLDRDTGTYGVWQSLSSIGPCNNARDGDRVRVRLQYEHHLISGGFFAGLADDTEAQTTTLSAVTTLRRD